MGIIRRNRKAPHLWCSEILDWREGDELFARNAKAKNWFSKLMAFEDGKLNISYYYKGITKDGFILIEEKDSGHMHKLEFYTFIKRAKNMSYNNRSVYSEIEHSKEYMILIDEFQKAYLELEETDKPKLLTEDELIQK